MDTNFEIKEKLAQLEHALNEAIPNIKGVLQTIHKQLKADPEIVTLLSEEECAIIVRGLKKQTNTEIAVTALKGSKKKAKISISDL